MMACESLVEVDLGLLSATSCSQGKVRSGLAYSLGRALNTRSLPTFKLRYLLVEVEANHPQSWHHALTAKPTRCHVVVSIVQYWGIAPLD